MSEEMRGNSISTDGWSSPDAQRLYESKWDGDTDLVQQYEDGLQCGGCSFYAAFNPDWGLCCHGKAPHHLQTVFEHFTCRAYFHEGWGPHSFTEDKSFHCTCGGSGQETKESGEGD